LRSLKASLSMEKYNAQLRDKDTYTGWVLYAPGSGRETSVRIEWQKPQHEILAVSNGKFQLYRPRLAQVIEGKTTNSIKDKAGAGGVLDMIGMTRAQLEQRFQ